MTRLIKDGDIILDGTLSRAEKEKQAFAKLETLENIEENLGCELSQLFANVIYVKGKGFGDDIETIACPIRYYDDFRKAFDFHYSHRYLRDGLIYLKDFGKTWSTRKEDLL